MFAEFASFDPRGLTAFQQALASIVERWLRRPQHERDVRDPPRSSGSRVGGPYDVV
jgi:hypothetical protein